VAVPASARYCADVHAVQAVQAVALATVVKPEVQCEHARSAVAEPAAEMKSPGVQLLQAAQLVIDC
jgi:hypothetical protein